MPSIRALFNERNYKYALINLAKDLNRILSKQERKSSMHLLVYCVNTCTWNENIISHWFTWLFHHYYLIYDSTCNSHSTSYTRKRGWALFLTTYLLSLRDSRADTWHRVYISLLYNGRRWLSNLSPYLVALRIKCWFVQASCFFLYKKKRLEKI